MVDAAQPVTTADTTAPTTPTTPSAPSMPATPSTPSSAPTAGPAPVPVPSTPTTPVDPAASNDTGDDIEDVADDVGNNVEESVADIENEFEGDDVEDVADDVGSNIEESVNDAENELEGDDAEDVAEDVGNEVDDAVDDATGDDDGDDGSDGDSGDVPTTPGAPAAEAPAGVYGLQPTEILENDVFANAEHFYRSNTRAYNDSGAQATVLLAHDMDSGTVTAIVHAMGVEADQLHPQHIHSFIDGQPSILPASTRDGDGDGYVEAAGTIPDLGAIRIPLTSSETGGYPRAVADQQAADPGTDSPTSPGTEDPATPGSETPTDPTGETPSTPVGDPPPSETPTAPGAGDPTDGSTASPMAAAADMSDADTGAAGPTDPGSDAAATPGATPDPDGSGAGEAGTSSGMYYFAETYDVPESITTFETTAFDLHGLSVPEGIGAGTPLEVDGTGGYKAALPIAAGLFTEISSAEALGVFADLSQPAFEDARMEDLLAFDSAYQSEIVGFERASVESFRETLLSLAQDYGAGTSTQADFNAGVTEAQSALESELAALDELDQNPASGNMDPGSDMMMA